MGVPRFQLVKTDDGGFRFSLLGSTGRVVATSETYRSKPSCLKALETLRTAAPKAVLDDETARPATSPNTPEPVAKAARAAGRAVGKAKKAVGATAPSAPPKGRSTRAAKPSAKPRGGKKK